MIKDEKYTIRFKAGQEINLKLIKIVDGVARYESFYSVIDELEQKNTFRIVVEQSAFTTKEKLFFRIIEPKTNSK